MRMKKADKVLGLAALVVCLVLFMIQMFGTDTGASVVVEIDGDTYGVYELSKDAEIDIGKTNQIRIEDGSVRMEDADCPDHLCVRQGTISKSGQMIVCLPNRVTIRITDEHAGISEDVPDAVAG